MNKSTNQTLSGQGNFSFWVKLYMPRSLLHVVPVIFTVSPVEIKDNIKAVEIIIILFLAVLQASR